ncbi:MAG: hypothetical protein NDI69_11115 [Bacteriovoracaceae bacterium]|nr:hypothetical protein [Bacteriovoracaceae bacterium]
MKITILMTLFILTSCSSFEKKFTSHVGCPEEEVKILKRDYSPIGFQSHTVSCRGQVYYCTEKMSESIPQELRCKKALPKTKLSNK